MNKLKVFLGWAFDNEEDEAAFVDNAVKNNIIEANRLKKEIESSIKEYEVIKRLYLKPKDDKYAVESD